MSWRTAALSDLGQIIGGGTPSTKEPLNFGDDYPWITPKDLSRQGQRYIDHGERGISIVGLTRSSAKLLPAGSVILSSRAPIGLTAIATVPVSTNQGCRSFVPGEDADSLFMYYLLGSMTDQMERLANGSTFKEISGSTLAAIEVSVPHLEEQRAIAATLGALDDKSESNQRKLRLVDDLFQAKWRKVSSRTTTSRRLGDLVSTQYGLTASASVETEGPRFLRVTDINKANWVSWSSVPSANITETDWRKYRLTKGDLLVARMADPGKSAIYDEESVDAVFASYLVRLKAGSYAESLYLYGFLKSELYADYAAGATTGSVQKNMNAKVIVDVDVPWPNVSEIDSFANSTAPLRAAINQLVRECDDLRTLRDALLPELLAGRLRVPESHENSHEVSA